MKIKASVIGLLSLLFSCTTPPKITPPAEKMEESPAIKNYFWAVKPSVNIREQASSSAALVGQIQDGDSVVVVNNENGWYQVKGENFPSGWIRSDLLGPKNASPFQRALKFTNDLNLKKINVFLDKQNPYQKIYLTFPIEYYSDRKKMEILTEEIAELYQKKVYRGAVQVRVLDSAAQEPFILISRKSKPNSEIELPVLSFGELKQINFENPTVLTLIVELKSSIEKNVLLHEAKHISSGYPLPYNHIEILFTLKLNTQDIKCLLWFIEDENGVDYKFNFCPEMLLSESSADKSKD